MSDAKASSDVMLVVSDSGRRPGTEALLRSACDSWAMPPGALFACRCAFLAYWTAVLVLSAATHSERHAKSGPIRPWPVFFTNWAICVQELFLLLAVPCSLLFLCRRRCHSRYNNVEDLFSLELFCRMCAVAFGTAWVFACVATLVFWCLLVPLRPLKGEPAAFLALSVHEHGVGLLMLLFELLVGRVTLRPIDVLGPVAVGAAYLCLHLTYSLTTGNYIYRGFLTWKSPVDAAIAAGVLLLAVCMFVVAFAAIKAREKRLCASHAKQPSGSSDSGAS